MPSANEIQHGGSHYKNTTGIQHWDLCCDYGVGYMEGCATKYVYRWRLKNGLEDLQKAEHFVVKLIEKVEARTYPAYGKVPLHVVYQFCEENKVGCLERDFLAKMFAWTSREELDSALEDVRALIMNFKVEGLA